MLALKLDHSKVILSINNKKYQSVLTSGDTNLLHKNTKPKKSKNYPINKIFPKIIKSLKILKQRFNKLKHTNRRITQIIIILPKKMSKFQMTTKIILMKNHKLKQTKIRITQMLILLPKIMSQVQVTKK